MKGLFENFGIAIFSFNCLTNFFSVANQIARPNKRRLRKVFIRSFIILGILLLTVGLLGYLSVGMKALKDKSNIDLIIYRPKLGATDYLMEYGRMFLIISLLVNAGINAFPLKIMLAHAIDWEMKGWRNLLLSFIFTIVPVVISSAFTGITDYVSFTGSFTGSLLCFTFNGILAIKIGYFKNKIMKVLMYVWTIVITVLCMICTGYAGIKVFAKKWVWC